MADLLSQIIPGPSDGPFSQVATVLDGAGAAAEGLWIPTWPLKAATLELTGSISTMSVSLLGTNQIDEPLNQFTLTIGGTVTTGDVVSVTATNRQIPGGSATVSYTTIGGDTTTTIAAALAALMTQSPGMQGAGIVARSAAAVITASFPSVWPQGAGPVPSYGTAFANRTVFSGSSNGAATETVTVAAVTTPGSAIGSAITALGLTAISIIPRWFRARLTAITGTNAVVTGILAGTG